ncbi:Hypothetical protein c0320 [Escherichia coli CFT073]|uniref:Uncharacterized protein n=1 Tax=Escherichia coli O6:H1 (strain CFT073 / ATCC 700928 / UPEC) TaxID=199310 RepID=A0A0H2V6C2_ECOL6|nr:Hypothetical protein c0320 [Escherichia coli CFT073]
MLVHLRHRKNIKRTYYLEKMMDAGALPAGLLSVPSRNYYVSPIYVFFYFYC